LPFLFVLDVTIIGLVISVLTKGQEMKNSRMLMVIMLLFVAASCSSKKKDAYHGSMDNSIEMSDVSTSDGVEGIDADESISLESSSGDEIQSNSDSADYVADADDVQGIEEGDQENQDLMVVDVDKEQASEPVQEEVLAENSSGVQEEQISLSQDVAEYTVQKGDTLMQIAFKLYGDFGRWKDIKALNPDVDGALKMGSIIKYNIPESQFKWVPKGSPYLVMRGDTLSSISHKVYEKASWWTHIHENNKPMIKDPDQIFAGFTLYYLPKEDIESKRDLASQ
jgi:LysM repeat protein